MGKYSLEIHVMPRRTLLDPQGLAVEHALTALQFGGVSNVRVGRLLTIDLESPDRAGAERSAVSMCQRLLANPVTEDFTVVVRETT
jgi:phosphoribosylformylglycinamidine synthase